MVFLDRMIGEETTLRIMEDATGENLLFFAGKSRIPPALGLQAAKEILRVGNYELAEILGITNSTLTQWLSPESHRQPSNTSLMRLRVALLRHRIKNSRRKSEQGT